MYERKTKIVHARGPSNINLGIFNLSVPLMFAGLHNQSPLLAMHTFNRKSYFWHLTMVILKITRLKFDLNDRHVPANFQT